MNEYDIVIIGTGPAGLSAAIEATIRNKKVLLLGSKNGSSKINKAPKIDNYLGIFNISGSDLNKKFLEHIKRLDIEIIDKKVTAIYKNNNSFNILCGQDFYIASSVILATGVNFSKTYDGESLLLGHGVSYCATCDGNLYKDKVIAIICNNKEEENEVKYLYSLAKKVYYFPLYKDVSSQFNSILEKPISIVGQEKVEKLVTNNNEYLVDGVFILRDSISLNNLINGLIIEKNNVVVDENMETNIKGIFASGDITGKPYQCIKAAGDGLTAALSAIDYIDNKKNS